MQEVIHYCSDTRAKIEVDPQTYVVTVDGEVAYSEPVSELPLAQRYYLF